MKRLAPSYTDNEMFTCPCENGYYWNETVKDCVAHCNDSNAEWNPNSLNDN